MFFQGNITLEGILLFLLDEAFGNVFDVYVKSRKSQIISKGLFVILEFSQKTNEQFCFYYYHEFVCLFFRNSRITKSPFEISI